MEVLPITTTHEKEFKSCLRMRYFLTKHLIQHILQRPFAAPTNISYSNQLFTGTSTWIIFRKSQEYYDNTQKNR
ncbi:hypothetical protein LDENG_00162670 [Lucifuga dentata]|nr:hypothetical protein LDENG_00162670 [Lucifuga dentata]